jgi:hypothetical protein
MHVPQDFNFLRICDKIHNLGGECNISKIETSKPGMTMYHCLTAFDKTINLESCSAKKHNTFFDVDQHHPVFLEVTNKLITAWTSATLKSQIVFQDFDVPQKETNTIDCAKKRDTIPITIQIRSSDVRPRNETDTTPPKRASTVLPSYANKRQKTTTSPSDYYRQLAI